MSIINAQPDPTAFQTYKLIPGQAWFLLYGGSSEDGRGPGKYMGRTFFPSHALTFYRTEIKKHGGYATGYIQAVFEDRTEHVNEEWLKMEVKRQDRLMLKINAIRAEKGLSSTMKPKGKPEGYGAFA